MSRIAIVLCVTTLALAVSSPASGQGLAVDPADGPIVDYDEQRENYSEFWERALSPAAGTYEDLVAQASVLVAGNKKPDDARTLLVDAISSRPSAPIAHFWLGQLELKQNNYEACSKALSKARQLEPSFRAPTNRSSLPAAWQLEYDLGLCLALSGDLAAALERFDSILNRFPTCPARGRDCVRWQVPWRMGETLMALGRLEEAIATLQSASSGAVALQYTLAVALERDEQIAASKAMLDRAISSDRSLRSLTNRDNYIPASDELYYRGLARLGRGEHAHARLFFAAFLEREPRSPWRSRALDHLKAAEAKAASNALLEVRTIEIAKAAAALKSGFGTFEKCTRGFPAQLFLVQINLRLEGSGRRTTMNQSATVQHYDPIGKKRLSTDIIKVTRCLRGAAEALPISKLRGAAGTSGYLRFYVGGS